MPMGPLPSWAMKTTIWDLYAKMGRRPDVIIRDIDKLIGQDKPLQGESAPDRRTVIKVIDELQTIAVDIVRTLPPHVQRCRNDWAQIEQEFKRPSEMSLLISIEKAGSPVPVYETWKSGILIAFTIANLSDRLMVVERICMMVLEYKKSGSGPKISAIMVPVKRVVHLEPKVGEYLAIGERCKYASGDAEYFEVTCISSKGVSYSAQLSAYCNDILSGQTFNVNSQVFTLRFPKGAGKKPNLAPLPWAY